MDSTAGTCRGLEYQANAPLPLWSTGLLGRQELIILGTCAVACVVFRTLGRQRRTTVSLRRGCFSKPH